MVVTWGSYGGDSSCVSSELGSDVTEIFSTDESFAALKSDGSVVTWTGSGYCDGSVSVTSGVLYIYAAYNSFAALKSDGSVVTWGSGDGSDSSSVSSDLASGVVDICSTLAAHSGAYAALKSDGSVVTWGQSDHGGDSDSVSSSLSSGVISIYSTDSAFAAILEI